VRISRRKLPYVSLKTSGYCPIPRNMLIKVNWPVLGLHPPNHNEHAKILEKVRTRFVSRDETAIAAAKDDLSVVLS
jgi:hypothetical protein